MNKLLSRFPLFELCYENVKHSKIPKLYNNLYIAIPFGKKFFVWFTYYEDKNICLLLEIDKLPHLTTLFAINFYLHLNLRL